MINITGIPKQKQLKQVFMIFEKKHIVTKLENVNKVMINYEKEGELRTQTSFFATVTKLSIIYNRIIFL